MKYYAKIGTSEEVIDQTAYPKCPEGYIEMVESRPTDGEYVAKEDGTWVKSNASAKAKLFAEMDALDLKSVRAARAVALAVSQGKTPDQADVNKLAEIEQEMKALRTKAFMVK